MKLGTKILIILIAIFVAIFAIIYTYFTLLGKSIAISQLENATKRKVAISSFNITPPLNIKLRNLNIEGLIKADSVSISPSIIGLLLGNLALNEVSILRPEFTYERASPTAGPQSAPVVEAKKKQPFRLIIKNLNIRDGRINFIDHTVGPEGIQIMIKDLNFKLTNIYTLPRSLITNFELKAKIPWQQGKDEGKIQAAGWFNFFKKDMQASLKIEDIDGIYLYPYYSNWVDLEKARIEKAKLNFTSDINGLNNNVTAQCRLELADIVRKPRAPEEGAEKAERITDAVLDILKALNQGKIVLDFTIRTKMDRPEFSFGNIKMAFEEKLAQGKKASGFKAEDVLKLPGNLLQGTVKSATDLTKAVIDGVFSVGKGLKEAVGDTFRREPEESKENK